MVDECGRVKSVKRGRRRDLQAEIVRRKIRTEQEW